MNNLEKYNEAFKTAFKVTDKALKKDFRVDTVARWDSLAHLNLVIAIENAFGVMLDPEDIMEFRSYESGKSILAKHDIEI